MRVKHINSLGKEYTFNMNKDKNVEWEGPFEYYRSNADDDKNLIMVEPHGGPLLKRGQMLSHIIWDDDFNVIIEKFAKTEKGFTIITKEHKFDETDFKHLEDRDIIGGII